jgi:hypothetical protein
MPIQFGPLRLGEKFLVRILGRALQGRVGLVGPNPLEIRFAVFSAGAGAAAEAAGA